MRKTGPLAQVGHLVLTEEEIRFTPRGLERAVGAETTTIDVLSIDEMRRVRGLESELRLRVEDQEYCFGGRGAAWLALRLRSMLLDPGGELEPMECFSPGEPIVICGDVSVYLLGFLASRGEVLVTDRRIRVRTTGGVESWILGKRLLDCRLQDIRDIQHRGVRRAFTITHDQSRIAIGGGVTSKVAAALGAVMIDAQVPGRWNEHVGLESVFDAQQLQGPRYVPGVLAVSTRALHFTPSGRLDSAVGTREVSIDLEDIHRIGLSGHSDPRLEVSASAGSVSFLMEDSRECFQGLVQGFQHMNPESPLGNRPMEFLNPVEVDCFLSGWKNQLESGEELRLLDWSLQWLNSTTVSMGWLMLTTARLVFLSNSAQDGGLRSDVYRVEDLGRLDGDVGSDVLTFNCRDQTLKFTHATGAEWVARFWQQCDAPTVMRGSQESRQKRTLMRLSGRVSFLRVLKGTQEVLREEDCRLVAEDGGISIKLVADQADLLRKLGSGRVEIGQPEGIYHFNMRVVHAKALDEGEFRVGREKIVFIALSQVLLMNRRDGFRMAVAFIVDVQFSGSIEKEAQNCVVDDLSIGGVAVSVPWELPHGVVAELELPVLGEPLKVRGRVVRMVQEGGGVRRWRYALAFFGLEDVDRSRINQLVLDQQRKRLRK